MDVFIRRSWWVFLFMAVCLGMHLHGLYKKNQVHKELKTRLETLQSEKEIALQERDELQRQVSSQDDPAYIELLLKKGLGVVPDGQIKVYFTNE